MAELHAIPATAVAEPPAAVSPAAGSYTVSRLTETDLQQRSSAGEEQSLKGQSGWLGSWFRRPAAESVPVPDGQPIAVPAARPAAVQLEIAVQKESGSGAARSGAGSLSRAGHSLTTSFSSTPAVQPTPSPVAAKATTPLADSAGVRCLPS